MVRVRVFENSVPELLAGIKFGGWASIIAIAKISADLNLSVVYGIAIRIYYASKTLWWILIW